MRTFRPCNLALICIALVSCAATSDTDIPTEDASTSASASTVAMAQAEKTLPIMNTESAVLTTVTGVMPVPYRDQADCRVSPGSQLSDGIAYLISPDGKSAVYWGCQAGQEKFLFANGTLIKGFEEIVEPLFSADGRHMAFFIKEDGKWSVSLDGKKEEIDGQPGNGKGPAMSFGPDGRFAYTIRSTKGQFLVIDGNKHGPYADVSSPVFSADGGNVAWLGMESDEIDGQGVGYGRQGAFVFVNGKRSEKYIMANSPVFMPDGKSVAYIAVTGADNATKKAVCQLVLGDKKSAYNCSDEEMLLEMAYGAPNPIVFSPDGGTVAYPVLLEAGEHTATRTIRERRTGLSVNGETVTEDFYSLIPPAFNPVTGKIAYATRKKGSDGKLVSAVVYDGQEYGPYSGDVGPSSVSSVVGVLFPGRQHSFVFSADGAHMLFIGKERLEARPYRSSFLVIDGQRQGQAYEEIKGVTLSRDGRRIGFVGSRVNEQSFVKDMVVLDGKESEEFSSADFIVFSDDGAHVAYVGGKNGKTAVYIDGVEQQGVDEILAPPQFTSDGRLVYGALKGKDIIWVATDVIAPGA